MLPLDYPRNWLIALAAVAVLTGVLLVGIRVLRRWTACRRAPPG
ncbi:hypothetical protein [Streptomyces sp. NBC_01210]